MFVERRCRPVLPDAEPVVLDVYGSLLYAGRQDPGGPAARAPAPARPVVILRLRGRTSLGSTFFGVIAGYADQLEAAGGRLLPVRCRPGDGAPVPPQPASEVRKEDHDLPRDRGARRIHARGGGGRAGLVGRADVADPDHPVTRHGSTRADRGPVLTLAATARYSG